MHIEPGVVDGAKLAISYLTAAGAIGYAVKSSLSTAKRVELQRLPHAA